MKHRAPTRPSVLVPKSVRSQKPAATAFERRDCLFALALVVAVILVYQPALRGGLIWDDDAHVTRPELQSWQGLYRIWFDLRATQQYYPLLHSAFWIEHRLWGDAVLGYHLTNILLHAAAALLAALVLRRLKIPGAYLAAAIFALHPVAVESVAWITEQKNTLSAVFYLGAMLAYLRFDEGRKPPWYLAALGLFAMGLLSKTVIATLPGALLVIFWWQRGRLSWQRDVLPLLPFFFLGAECGLFTAWVERKLIGAEGAAFVLTYVERFLLAGRVVWFYLAKLFWPRELLFIYPRWQISQSAWWQYMFPLALAFLLAGLWASRRRWRGPLAALLFFVGTLFPVLGFFNVFPFIYSFVADHFQYLASLGIITLASAGLATSLDHWGLWRRPAGNAACLAMLAGLAALTWQQSRMYADVDTLYRTTIARNPACWMPYNNLGLIVYGRGQADEATTLFNTAIEIEPGCAQAYNNLGTIFAARGQLAQAIVAFRKALESQPEFVEAELNLGHALTVAGQFDDAVDQFERALNIAPDNPKAHCNFGRALYEHGDAEEAIGEYRKALEIDPNDVGAHCGLANALAACGNLDETMTHCHAILEIKPDFAPARRQLATIREQREVLRRTLVEQRETLRQSPNDLALLNDVARLLATSPNASIRNGGEAVNLAQRAVELSKGAEPAILDTLAAAYAEAGRFPEAVQTAHAALQLATEQDKPSLAESMKARTSAYEAGIAFRELPQTAPSLRTNLSGE
jgi:protein O-mannosyl-transferase